MNQAFNAKNSRHFNNKRHEQSNHSSAGNRDMRTIRCFYCKKLGHRVSDCYKKKNSAVVAEQNEISDSSFFLDGCHATSDLKCESKVILADSGGTRHMSPCLESFDDNLSLSLMGTKMGQYSNG